MSGTILVKAAGLIYCRSLFSNLRLSSLSMEVCSREGAMFGFSSFFHQSWATTSPCSHHLLALSIASCCFLSCRFGGSRRKWSGGFGEIWLEIVPSLADVYSLGPVGESFLHSAPSWALGETLCPPLVPLTSADKPLISLLGYREDSGFFFRSWASS